MQRSPESIPNFKRLVALSATILNISSASFCLNAAAPEPPNSLRVFKGTNAPTSGAKDSNATANSVTNFYVATNGLDSNPGTQYQPLATLETAQSAIQQANKTGTAANFYVATNGLDSNPGTQEQPFATLEAAQSAIRQAKKTAPTYSVTVWIRGGTYYRSNSFALDARDSGTNNAPITYLGFPNETAVFTGAKAITNFASVSDSAILSRLPASARGLVLVSDISGLGVADYGSLTNRGALTRNSFTRAVPRPWMVELFFDNRRQQLARWPNQDRSEEVWAYTVAPVPGQWKENPKDNWFSYRENNPSNWAMKETVWVHGGWCYWWDDSYEQIIAIDTAAKKITTIRPGDNGNTANAPYEALNVLEELDQPGEWVIDRAKNLIYFWPPSTNANQRTTLSTLASDLVTLTNAANIQFQNLSFDGGRGSGVSMRRSTNIVVAGCEFRNFGSRGVVVGNSPYTNSMTFLPLNYDYEGGLSNRVVGCHLHDLGEGGIVLSGGDRVTLTPSGHAAINNYIHHFNVNIRCSRPAIALNGVGMTISHAVIHDSPHEAIYFEGNDHLIEYCNIYRIGKDTSDAGAIYSCGADWRQRGTVIRYNFLQPAGVSGIYLDDFTSGVSVYGNILMNISPGTLLGGGRDNNVFNNLYVGVNYTSCNISSRGNTWAAGSIPSLATKFKTINPKSGPYAKYPGMSVLQADIAVYQASSSSNNLFELALAKNNHYNRNIEVYASSLLYDITTNRFEQVSNFHYYALSVFKDFTVGSTLAAEQQRNFKINSTSAPILAGFPQIPQANIGISSDTYGLVSPSMVPAYPPALPRSPFLGHSLQIPGIVQVEDYDEGTNACFNAAIDYYGNYAWGNGRYRLESPFPIWGSVQNGRRIYAMDIFYAPSWLEYTVDIAQAANYSVTLGFTTYSNGVFSVALDGKKIASGLTGTNKTATLKLPLGSHVLRLALDVTGASRLDYMEFRKVP